MLAFKFQNKYADWSAEVVKYAENENREKINPMVWMSQY